MAKVKFLIKDEDTIVLDQDAKKGDYIDLTEDADLDTKSVIKNFSAKLNNLAKEQAQTLSETEVLKAVREKEREIAQLEARIKAFKSEVDAAVLKAQAAKDEDIADLKEQLHNKVDEIKKLENQWNHRHTSTKSFGEELENYVWQEFEGAQQKGAFPLAKFWKDNEVISSGEGLKGTKGDFIFKDYDDKGNELLTIEIEVKTEQNTTESKKHNKDHYKKLDDDRNKKGCEYALLISELDRDNVNFDGVYKVREYEKMYVVRPQTFVAFINVLKDSLNKNHELIQVINQKKLENLDEETFIANINDLKVDIQGTVERAHKNYDAAIKAIDDTIDKLNTVKASLQKSGDQLTTANNKVQGITMRKLKKGCKEDPFKK